MQIISICEAFRISIERTFHECSYGLNISKYHSNRQYKIYLNIRVTSDKYTTENSLTHSSIQKTSFDIQSDRIYIETSFFIHCQFEFEEHYMQNEYLTLQKSSFLLNDLITILSMI